MMINGYLREALEKMIQKFLKRKRLWIGMLIVAGLSLVLGCRLWLGTNSAIKAQVIIDVPSALNEPVSVEGFSPDGSRLVILYESIDGEPTLAVWDLKSGKLQKKIDANKNSVGATYGMKFLGFSPSGQIMVTGDSNGEAKFWNTTTWRVQRSVNMPTNFDINGFVKCEFVSENIVVLVDNVRRITVWDLLAGTKVADLDSEYFEFIRELEFVETRIPDGSGKLIAVMSKRNAENEENVDLIVFLWSTSGWASQGSVKITSSYLESASISPDGKKIVGITFEGDLHVWDIDTGRERLVLRLPKLPPQSYWSPFGFWNPKSDCLVVWNSQGDIYVCYAEKGVIKKIDDRALPIFSHAGSPLFSFLAKGEMFVSVSEQVESYNAWITKLPTFLQQSASRFFGKPGYSKFYRLKFEKSAEAVTKNMNYKKIKIDDYIDSGVFSPDGSALAISSNQRIYVYKTN